MVSTPYSGHDLYVGRLAIPYLSPAGVTTLRFRALGDEKPKYLGMPKVQSGIYNVGALAVASSFIAICEGEFDALVTDELAGIPAVGMPGANSWKAIYGFLFKHYDRVLVVGDGDEAGRLMMQEITAELDKAVPVPLPEGMDANDYYLEEGPQGLADLLKRKL